MFDFSISENDAFYGKEGIDESNNKLAVKNWEHL
jgi:hypothetical protein